ncbi:MAG TPA: PAS domain-containing sensor histidine kinase [Candidatus Thermoplasmatota archaeon]|nr:PAS domain-containing sensor histidine kinase [Candidatus Thermoplasmatota archaeon]
MPPTDMDAGSASPAEQKAFSAEQNTAWLRFAVVAFNVTLYWAVLYPAGDPPVAAATTVVALVYIVYIVGFQPYRRYPILATSLWTTLTDGTLIPVWVYATGGFESPFYVLWFLSLFAVTFRYNWRAPLAAALVYIATYLALLLLERSLATHVTDILVRVVYLLLAGILGSLLARESLRVFEERYRMGQTLQESRHLRDLAEASPEALVIASDGIIVEANRAYCELMGQPRDRVIGTPPPPPIPLDATAPQGVEAWLTRPDGERVLVRAVANPLDYGGKPALFAALRDVTDERAAQATREQALQSEMEVRRLREVDRFKSDFINAAAHELNTPLTPLKLQLHILKKKLPKDSSLERRTVDILDRNLERLVWLVDEMLDVARMNSGRLRLRPVDSDLARLARETVETFVETARARSISLRVDAPDALPGVLDPQRVTQVLYNLVSNAVKFTPAGGRVDVRIRGDGAMLEATVTDTGAGFTQGQAQRLFQPFSRQHRDQVDAPGTGLGLYISLGIVERHGGTLTCRSDGPGQGATFTLRLPRAGPVEVPSPPLPR